jgi:hypothetical protein
MEQEIKKEEAVSRALKLKDEGKPLSFILEKMPDEAEEIKEIFGVAKFLSLNKDVVKPPAKLLRNILVSLASEKKPEVALVTKPERERYSLEEEKVESRKIISNAGVNSSFFMKTSFKLIFAVLSLAVVAGVGIYFYQGQPAEVAELSNENIPAPTDSIDDFIIALEKESGGENLYFEQSNADAASYYADEQTINSLINVYDETQL